MTIQYSTTHRTNVVTDVVTQAGATAYLLFYSGAAPGSCASAPTGTLLASLPCSNPIGSVASGVLTFSTITSANTTSAGTAGYWRLCTSIAGSTVIAQGSVNTAGADINFSGGVVWTLSENISISSLSITAAGA